MRLLLDTHAFLWLMAGSKTLGARARRAAENPRNERYLSIASLWEMAIKLSLGKLRIGLPLAELIEQGALEAGITLLEIRAEHVLAVSTLPWHHSDPFDRMLVAQARSEELVILSLDSAFDDYGLRRLW